MMNHDTSASDASLTVSPAAPPVNPEPAETRNTDFLAAIFSGLGAEDRPVVVSIKGTIGASTKWPAEMPKLLTRVGRREQRNAGRVRHLLRLSPAVIPA